MALLFGLSCGALGRLLLRDADIGWHIRNGQQMWLTHSITRTDSFSSTMSGQTWYAWEWLYDLGVAAIHHVFGLNGVVFYSAAIIAATFVLTLHLALRGGSSLPVALMLLIVALGASAIHFLARPHLVSWLFTVIWFVVLDSTVEGKSPQTRAVFALPLLMLLWVNLHGGFVMGFMLLGIFLLAGAVRYARDGEDRHEIEPWLRRLGAVMVLSALASLVNPYGYHLHAHVYRYLSDRFLMSQISEFQSPDFHGAAQQCFAVLLLITVSTVSCARRKPSLERVLVILLAAGGGLYATRNLPTSSLLIVLCVAPVLTDVITTAAESDGISWWRGLCSRVRSFGGRMEAMESRMAGHVWLIAAFLAGLWACANHGRLGSTQFINAYFDEKRFPVEAAEVIATRDIREPIFSLDYWGGYLIYRLYPETKVVLDDRHDLYGSQFFKDFLKVILVQPDWEKTLDGWQVDWVLVPTEGSLANMMRLSGNWQLSHEDRTAALFHRIRK